MSQLRETYWKISEVSSPGEVFEDTVWPRYSPILAHCEYKHTSALVKLSAQGLFWSLTIQCFPTGKKIGSLTVDKKFIYWSTETKEYTEIWLANKESTRHFLQKRANHELKILAYSSAAQLYPGIGDLGFFVNVTNLLQSMYLSGRSCYVYLCKVWFMDSGTF